MMGKALFSFAVALSTAASAVCLDKTAAGPEAALFRLSGEECLRIDILKPNLFRVRLAETKDGKTVWNESGLNRYGFYKADYAVPKFEKNLRGIKTSETEITVNAKAGALGFTTPKRTLTMKPRIVGKGFEVRFDLSDGERIYGLGDVSRANIMRRGGVYDVWVKNVKGYAPVPMMTSSDGWGMLANSTWRHQWDVGHGVKDEMTITAPEGPVDFYVFTGADRRALLATYTELTGRPKLLPIWGYGHTFINNQWIDQWALMNDARLFREYKLPTDLFALGPGWMEKNYDLSTKKEWNKQRFNFPQYAPKGGHTWPSALARKGFKLALWLCCEYDLTRYEEDKLAGTAGRGEKQSYIPKGSPETWIDVHLEKGEDTEVAKVETGKIKANKGNEDEPWFEHLKKFVDQGVVSFRMDACNVVGEHPKRKWFNGMTDAEMHNLYPLVYDRQMSEGYEDYTGKRAMLCAACGYTGLQKYTATWAGDTGGGGGSLVYMLNMGMSGHPNTTCNMDVNKPDSIHFCFLSTMLQDMNWDYWYQPWFLADEDTARFKAYLYLRYRLIPYIYGTAAEASRTGWPTMRPLAWAYPDYPEYDNAKGEYMLGDSLLVSAFSKTISLPPGKWHDWWTGETVEGGREVPVKTTHEILGALYVKDGAIIPTWPVRQHLDKGWNEKVTFLVWPGQATSAAELYEDDGWTVADRKGTFATTKLACEKTAHGIKFTAGARKGAYEGMPKTRDFSAVFYLASAPTGATLDGKPVDFTWDDKAKLCEIALGPCGDTEKVVSLLLR